MDICHRLAKCALISVFPSEPLITLLACLTCFHINVSWYVSSIQDFQCYVKSVYRKYRITEHFDLKFSVWMPWREYKLVLFYPQVAKECFRPAGVPSCINIIQYHADMSSSRYYWTDYWTHNSIITAHIIYLY